MTLAMRSIVLTAALSISAAPALFASPMAQEPERRPEQRVQQEQRTEQEQRAVEQRNQPNYSRNSYYKMGNREGYQDYNKKTQRADHNHKYRSDDDRKAHDYGYQQGLAGQRGYHPNNRPDNQRDPH